MYLFSYNTVLYSSVSCGSLYDRPRLICDLPGVTAAGTSVLLARANSILSVESGLRNV